MDNTTAAVLATRDLTKRYGHFTALDKVSLTVYDGDIYGLVGRNGAGKTTLFKCLMGLATPTGGTFTIGADGTAPSLARRGMGFMITPSFFPYLDPVANLTYLSRVKRLSPAGEVGRVLEVVGLAGVRKPYKTFSLGMKQRLGIAGALLGSPRIVVLDEPVNGLDPQGIIDMRSVIQNAQAALGVTFVVSSHLLAELDMVATRFGFIEQGRLLTEITREDLHEHTKQSLTIAVDDVARTVAILSTQGVEATAGDGRVRVSTHLDEPDRIAYALVTGGVAVYDLHRETTTLEEFFVKLIGGGADA